MTNTESRLDRIERVLDNLATNQLNEMDARLAQREDLEIFYRTLQQVAENSEAERQQSNRNIATLAGHLDRLTVSVSQLTGKTDQLVEGQQVLQTGLDSLARQVVRLVENAEADRAETRRIWEYLESQRRTQGNGHGG